MLSSNAQIWLCFDIILIMVLHFCCILFTRGEGRKCNQYIYTPSIAGLWTENMKKGHEGDGKGKVSFFFIS